MPFGGVGDLLLRFCGEKWGPCRGKSEIRHVRRKLLCSSSGVVKSLEQATSGC